jgi:stage II sporulation protein E
MWKKVFLKIVLYSIVFLLLNLSESAIGVRGFCIAFLCALLYCRENMFIVLPLFIGSAMAINPSLNYLICVSVPMVIVLLSSLIHYKFQKKYSVFEINLVTLICQVPLFVYYAGSINQLVLTLVGVGVAQVFNYICIVLLYPVLVRGLKYRLSQKETLTFCIMLVVMSMGLGQLLPFNINIYYAVMSFMLLFFKGLDLRKILLVAISMGLGSCIPDANLYLFTLTVILGFVCIAMYPLNKYISALVLPASFLICYYYFIGDISLLVMLPVIVGSLLSILVPDKFYKLTNSYRQSYQERFALRTVVNRDRESISWRLSNIAKAFSDMQNILINESNDNLNSERLIEEICATVCDNCKLKDACRAKMGCSYKSVEKLVISALDNGKATILDATASLGDNCSLLPKLISVTNDRVSRYKAALYKKDGMEQGKEMIINQMGGVADLISKLSDSINTGFSYDTKLETKLIDELAYHNIVASDVVIYGKSKCIEEVSIMVREKDANKKSLDQIVSKIMNRRMEVIKKSRDVNGMVSLCLNPAPKYKALFGECVIGKQNRCGDTRQAVKISRDKIMFVLSDGMGSGENAYITANNIIVLIENFYKAGFDHNTILSTVSKLLALRSKEDFSALDIVILDTQNGNIDFIKQGGRESYLYDGLTVDIVEGGSLPIGIIEEAEPQIESRVLKVNQLLVMSSDGVADYIGKESMSELLTGIGTYNPQHIAEQVVENAQRISGKNVDDMTCMVIKLAEM